MKAIVLFSGGLDSTVLLAEMVSIYGTHNVLALSVNYGQRHSIELRSAERIVKHYEVEHIVLDLSESLKPIFYGAASSQVGSKVDVPLGHYAAETMKTTIVPNRNMILLSLAAALAEVRGATTVAYAAHAGDHAIYPDCRPVFISAMIAALRFGTTNEVRLVTPFEQRDKAFIVQRGVTLQAPLHLTRSCYQSSELHCGECGTCVERREAFTNACVIDPTLYERDFTSSR